MVGHGSAAEEIVLIAKNESVDLIVISTHGSTGIERFVFGSVAEKVVRLVECPVLTVRHPEHEFVLPDALVALAKSSTTGEPQH